MSTRRLSKRVIPPFLVSAALLSVPQAALSQEEIQAYVGQKVVLQIKGKPSRDHVWRLNKEKSSADGIVDVKKLGWSIDNKAWYGDHGTLRYVVTPRVAGDSVVVIELGKKHKDPMAIKTATFKIKAIAPNADLSTASTKVDNVKKIEKMPWQN